MFSLMQMNLKLSYGWCGVMKERRKDLLLNTFTPSQKKKKRKKTHDQTARNDSNISQKSMSYFEHEMASN